jgi:endo-1,4-beta-xylanase
MKQFVILLLAATVLAFGCQSGPAPAANATNAMTTMAPTKPGVIYSTSFENGTGTEWKPKGGVQLSSSTDVAHTGTTSLKVSNRSETWFAPEMDITKLTETLGTYQISGWVSVPTGSTISAVKLTVETHAGESTNWIQIANPVPVEPGKWVQVVGKYVRQSGLDKASVYVEPLEKTGDYYIDDMEIDYLGQ